MSRWICAVLVCAGLALAGLLGCAGSAGQKPADGLDDALIVSQVKSAILREPTLKSADIEVESYGGEVRLSGTLDDQEEIYRAVKATRTVEGVRAVRNHLRLK